MRLLLRWTVKLAVLGVLYVGVTSGTDIRLPATILGFKVPDQAQQIVDSTVKQGKQTEAGLKQLAAGIH